MLDTLKRAIIPAGVIVLSIAVVALGAVSRPGLRVLTLTVPAIARGACDWRQKRWMMTHRSPASTTARR